MAKGGYRSGAGRPRLTDEEKARRAELRKAGLLPPGRITKKMAAKMAAEAAAKAAAAPKPAKKPSAKKPAAKTLPPEVPAAPEIPGDVVSEAAQAEMDPLTYMLTVMRDRGADPIRRDRMAIAAAPFVHPRKEPVGQGKKEAAANAAKSAAGGKFAPAAPPKLVVSNR